MSDTDEFEIRELENRKPLVSVIVPAYGAAHHIATAIDSILAQDFEDHEVIVVNDGSPDTEELERALSPYGKRITYLKQDHLGPGAARNRGILAARGVMIAFLDADDYWLPNFLNDQLAFLNDGRFDLVYADAMLAGDTPLAGRTFMQTVPSRGEVTLEALIAVRCTVLLSGVLARRSALIEAGLFDEQFTHSEDFDLWLRMARCGARLGYQQKVLLCKRERRSSLSAEVMTLLENALRVLKKTEATGGLTQSELSALGRSTKKIKAHLLLERGKKSLSAGDCDAAAEAIGEANNYYRSSKLMLVLLWLRLWPSLLLRFYRFRRGLGPLESGGAVSL
jgi:glycosyltransferase involved in cell wall biosynthesis